MAEKAEKPKPDDPDQSRRFEETTKRLEADESGRAFEKAMGTISTNVHDAKPDRPKGK